jgi:hypothetical protein
MRRTGIVVASLLPTLEKLQGATKNAKPLSADNRNPASVSASGCEAPEQEGASWGAIGSVRIRIARTAPLALCQNQRMPN